MMMIKGFGSNAGQLQSRNLVQVWVQGLTSETCLYVNAYTVPIISSPLQNQAVKFAATTYQHLNGLSLADSNSSNENESQLQVDFLIGTDYYWHFLTGSFKRGESGPTGLHTKIGWILSGPVQGSPDIGSTQVNFTNTHALRVETRLFEEQLPEDKTLDKKLSQFWELKSSGILSEERSVYEKFNDSIKYTNGWYEVELPWKETHLTLPDNYLPDSYQSLIRRLQSEEIIGEYDAVIRDQLKNGIIERADHSMPTPRKDSPFVTPSSNQPWQRHD